MGSNTFRINVGESAKPYLQPKYIDSLNESLSYFEDKVFGFAVKKPGKPSFLIGDLIDLTDKVNIVAIDFNQPEINSRGSGIHFKQTIESDKLRSLFVRENLIDKLNPNATSQIFLNKKYLERPTTLVKRVTQQIHDEHYYHRIYNIGTIAHEIGHAASYNANIGNYLLSPHSRATILDEGGLRIAPRNGG
jgi:hypothetical protein